MPDCVQPRWSGPLSRAQAAAWHGTEETAPQLSLPCRPTELPQMERQATHPSHSLIHNVSLLLSADPGVLLRGTAGKLLPCDKPEDAHKAKDVEHRGPVQDLQDSIKAMSLVIVSHQPKL